MDPNSPIFLRRIIGVLKLNRTRYAEIAADNTATPQAATIVLAVAAVYGIIGYTTSLTDMAFGFFGSIIIWLTLTAILHFVCNAFARTSTGDRNFSRIARLTGFAEAPGLFGIVQLLPGIGPVLAPILVGWGILTWFTSVREAGPFSSQAACLVMILQFVALIIFIFVVLFLILILFGVTSTTFQIGES